MKKGKVLVWIGVGVVVLAFVYSAFRPEPLDVEVAQAIVGPMRLTVDAEGRTRVRDRFVVSAPVSGRLGRVELSEGDSVRAGTVLALLSPIPLDIRAARQNEAALEAAESERMAAEARLDAVRATLAQAKRDLSRAEELASSELISRRDREQAELAKSSAEKAYESAAYAAKAAASNADSVRAALLASSANSAPSAAIKVVSPISGRLLRLLQESERIVAAGTPLAEIGDLKKIELVFEVLSTDAVKVRPGSEIVVEGWGGELALGGQVRNVEPSAFTKVSALGIEEQRVNVIGELVDSNQPLGDGFRIEGRIVIWEATDVLKIPVSALFRDDAGWSVFAVAEGRAVQCNVEVGHRNSTEAEVLKGLQKGDSIVLFPGDKLTSGAVVHAIPR